MFSIVSVKKETKNLISSSSTCTNGLLHRASCTDSIGLDKRLLAYFPHPHLTSTGHGGGGGKELDVSIGHLRQKSKKYENQGSVKS